MVVVVGVPELMKIMYFAVAVVAVVLIVVELLLLLLMVVVVCMDLYPMAPRNLFLHNAFDLYPMVPRILFLLPYHLHEAVVVVAVAVAYPKDHNTHNEA